MNGTGSQILLEDVDVAAQRNESIMALFSFEPEKREEVEQMLLSVNISRHRYVHTFFREFQLRAIISHFILVVPSKVADGAD